MCAGFRILIACFLLICHFEWNKACHSHRNECQLELTEREAVKGALNKIIDSNKKVNEDFTISKKVLGEGTSGIVYKGKRIKGDKADVAIKLEHCTAEFNLRSLIGLNSEYEIYHKLGACEGEPSFNKKLVGIPTIHYYGKYHSRYNVMVMTMIENTILVEFNRFRGALSRQTVFMIAIQMIERMQYIHERGVIAQDVKPENIGHKNGVIYLFDLNMAKLKGSTKFGLFAVGSPEYMSLSAHMGKVEEKDDMISLGFCMCRLYGNKLELPWMTDAQLSMSERFWTMKERKETIIIEDWLNSTNCSDASVFINYFNHLKPESTREINYAYLKGLFVNALTGTTNGKVEYIFDWMKK